MLGARREARRQQGRLGIVGSALILAFLAVLVLLAAGQALSYRNAGEMLGFDNWVEHSYQVVGQADQLAAALAAAESGARGYVVGKLPETRAEFNAARADAEARLSALADLTRDNPDQRNRILYLRQLAEERLGALDGFMQFRDSHDLQNLQQSVRSAPVIALREQLKAGLGGFKRTEAGLLSDRRDRFRGSVVRAKIGYWIECAIGVIGLIGFFALASRAIDATRQRGAVEAARARELEERVEDRTAELAEANEDLRSFSYSVAHDLKAPLRAISGFSQILKESLAEGHLDDAQSILDRILRAGTRMGGIIEGLTTLARLHEATIDSKSVDLGRLAEETMQHILTEQVAAHPEFTVEPDLRAHGDPTLLRILLNNLLSNAVKFSAPVDPPTVCVAKLEAAGESVYQIRDNGVGFDAAQAKRLFRPFERLHSVRDFEGSGLGLAICDRVVRRHGGRIWAESTPGKGTTVSFTLPVPAKSAEDAA